MIGLSFESTSLKTLINGTVVFMRKATRGQKFGSNNTVLRVFAPSTFLAHVLEHHFSEENIAIRACFAYKDFGE